MKTLRVQEKEAEKEHTRACRDEDKAWPNNAKQPKDPKAFSDATTRRANWFHRHLRTVGELVDQQKIRDLITDPAERDRWLADAADYLKGDVNGR